jgi:hypothetical protein
MLPALQLLWMAGAASTKKPQSQRKGNKVAANIEGKRRGDKAVLLPTISVPSSYLITSMVVEMI